MACRHTLHVAGSFALLVSSGCFNPTENDDTSSSGMDTGTTGEPPATTSTPDDTTGGSATSGPPPGDTSTGTPPADSSGDASSTGPSSECGNGIVEVDEECDDGNTDDGDGCAAGCTVDPGWQCDGGDPTACNTVCGDNMVGAPVEECDDGNMIPDDDCTDQCLNAVCGDGIVWLGNETCDDGAAADGDGCDATCQAEPGYLCQGAPSTCEPGVFLADGAAGTVGNLWVMSLDGMTTVDLGPLGVPLTAMAFHPTGTLYGVTSGAGGGGMGMPGVLGTIDLAGPMFNPIGPLTAAGGVAHTRVPDIAFMGTQLLGWTESGDDLILINTATAAVTVVPAPEFSFGTGFAYNSFNGNIYVAPDGADGPLWTVTPMGMMMAGPTLQGTAGRTVKGLSYFSGLLYGLDAGFSGDPAGDLVTYDPMSGATAVLGVLPTGTIDALAVYDPNN